MVEDAIPMIRRSSEPRESGHTSGVGPVLTNWCCVPAGTTIKSPALTSWSLPLMVAFPVPEVKVKAWSTVWTCMNECHQPLPTTLGCCSCTPYWKAPSRRACMRRLRKLTSSPMSPPTGTVISTTWLYKPVQSTLLNSALSEGNAEVMLGKYCISCLGGPDDILGSFALRTGLVFR